MAQELKFTEEELAKLLTSAETQGKIEALHEVLVAQYRLKPDDLRRKLVLELATLKDFH